MVPMSSSISSDNSVLRPRIIECPADAVHMTPLPGSGEAPIVWLIRVNATLPDLPGLATCLSQDEQRRAGRLRRDQERHQFQIGRGWLRILLGRVLGLSPDQVHLCIGQFGKPFVCSPPEGARIQFNVAHSGDVILLAFHQCCEVGIDVEEITDGQDWTTVADQVFPPEQIRNWSHLSPAQWTEEFFVAWTRKEAELKALGIGFAAEEVGRLDRSVQMFDLELPSGYVGALAVRSVPELCSGTATIAQKKSLGDLLTAETRDTVDSIM